MPAGAKAPKRSGQQILNLEELHPNGVDDDDCPSRRNSKDFLLGFNDKGLEGLDTPDLFPNLRALFGRDDVPTGERINPSVHHYEETKSWLFEGGGRGRVRNTNFGRSVSKPIFVTKNHEERPWPPQLLAN